MATTPLQIWRLATEPPTVDAQLPTGELRLGVSIDTLRMLAVRNAWPVEYMTTPPPSKSPLAPPLPPAPPPPPPKPATARHAEALREATKAVEE